MSDDYYDEWQTAEREVERLRAKLDAIHSTPHATLHCEILKLAEEQKT